MMDRTRLTYLFDRHTAGALTAAEELEFAAYVIDPAFGSDLAELEARYWEALKDAVDPLPEKAAASLKAILPARRIPLHRRLSAWSAAAVVLAVIGTAVFLGIFRKEQPPQVTIAPAATNELKPPAGNRARILLADGRTVYLDSAANGQLGMQGNVQLVKLANGRIAYQPMDAQAAAATVYNTLSNPRGSKVIDMVLSDGSRVWLNAGSSITYPVRFPENERQVTITGEAYLEVAYLPKHPFFVNKAETRIRVLGTRFNVNAYDDETDLRVTLLEGAVQVENGKQELKISPDQQAVVTAGGKIILNKQVDIAEVMAWKNGQFLFEGTGIHAVMRQIARWYDVEVEYQTEHPEQHLRGEIPRDVDASKVLKMLESTGAVKFRIEGKKIIVVNP